MAENFSMEMNDEVENFEVDFGEITRISNNDFNKLENRPSYAGEVMTGETSIPEVPSAVSELTNDANYQTGAQVATVVGAETTARENADAALDGRLTTVEGIAGTALQPESINKVVMTDIAVGANTSTTTFNLEAAKENLLTGATSSKQVSMPVASSTEAGIMNSSTFDAVSNNTSNINALLNGAVAITGLPAEPTQAQLTTAWETATGATALMNRAGIYDVTNGKVWTYYTNSSTWYSVTNTTQVTINTFTNNSEGTIKGSTNVGQIFAETDGTGSVNGWDALNDAVSNNTSDISDLETAMDGKQDKLIAGANINIASDGKTISATDTTYTAGNGINISAQNVISTDAPEGFFTLPATVEGEGSEITLNNTIGAKLDGMQVDGDTFQQTYSGKNLADFTTISFGDTNYGTGTRDGQTYSVTSTTNSYGGIYFEQINLLLEPSTTYTFSAKVVSTAATNGSSVYILGNMNTTGNNIAGNLATAGNITSATFTTPSTIPNNARIALYVRQQNASTVFTDLQIEKNSSATSWEPYTGGIPAPNPDYPQAVQTVTGAQTVKTTGKNLWGNISQYGRSTNGISFVTNQDGTISATGTATANAYSVLTSDAVSVGVYITLSAGTYTLSEKNNNTVQAYEAIAGSQVLADTSTSTVTFTLTETKNIVIRAVVPNGQAISGTQIFYPMLESGSTITNYQPYQLQSYTIDLGSIELCKIGDYQDYIYKSGDDWYVHKDIGKVDIVSSGIAAFNTHSGSHITVNYSNANVERLSAPAVTNASNRFIGCTSTQTWGGAVLNGVSQGTNNNYLQFSLPSSVATTQAEVRTYFNNHPTTVYYTLATPTDTKITDATLVGQLDALWNAMSYNGQTNFVVTASDSGALPAILEVKAYQKSLNGLLGAIERTNE